MLRLSLLVEWVGVTVILSGSANYSVAGKLHAIKTVIFRRFSVFEYNKGLLFGERKKAATSWQYMQHKNIWKILKKTGSGLKNQNYRHSHHKIALKYSILASFGQPCDQHIWVENMNLCNRDRGKNTFHNRSEFMILPLLKWFFFFNCSFSSEWKK